MKTSAIIRSFSRHRVEIVAVIVSLLLSAWLIHLDGVVNRDGVLYLRSAEAFANGHWKEGLEIYRWPLFALLIACAHITTGLSYEISAYAVNSVLYALLVWGFIRIVKVLGGRERVLWLAALFILVLPSLNSYRSFVIRDVGFWAFYFLALLFYFEFQVRPAAYRAFGWGIAMVIATLFRIEGVVFLLLLPLAEVRNRYGKKELFARLVQLYAVALAGLLAASAWLVTAGSAYAGRLLEPMVWARKFGDQLTSGLAEKADLLAAHVLNAFSDDFAMPSVLLILFLIVLTHVLKGLSLLGLFAALRTWFIKSMPASTNMKRALVWLVALHIAVLTVFVTDQFFLTGRYVIALVLTLALYAPFGLDDIYGRWRTRGAETPWKERAVFPLALVLACFMLVDSLWSFGPSNHYLRDAGLWARANISDKARLYSDNPIVAYYANRIDDTAQQNSHTLDEIFDAGRLRDYDYLAVVVKRKDRVPEEVAKAPVMQTFSNNRNDRVLIFSVADLQSVH